MLNEPWWGLQEQGLEMLIQAIAARLEITVSSVYWFRQLPVSTEPML